MSQVAWAMTFVSSSCEVEHLLVLGLERVGARGRGADDPIAPARVVGEESLFVVARSRARSYSPLLMSGSPQQTCSGTIVSKPFRRRTSIAASATCGS